MVEDLDSLEATEGMMFLSRASTGSAQIAVSSLSIFSRQLLIAVTWASLPFGRLLLDGADNAPRRAGGHQWRVLYATDKRLRERSPKGASSEKEGKD